MKLILVISENWYFWSHRLPIALEAKLRGWDVVLISRFSSYRNKIESLGVRTEHVNLRRGNLDPVHDLTYYKNLVELYRAERPDIVHHVALKPSLYGAMAAWGAGVPREV